MSKSEIKPRPPGNPAPVMISLGGLVVGLVLFIAFGVETSLYGVIPFALGGLAIGGVLGILWARRGKR